MNDAIGIWSNDNIIVEGHGRVMACRQLGIESVPCVRLDHMTDKQRREYAIAHNATAELSEWDFKALEIETVDIDLSKFDFEIVLDNQDAEMALDIDEETAKEDKSQILHCPMCGFYFEVKDE